MQPGEDDLLRWLAEALREARAGRKRVHFAAAADLDPSAISRLEKGEAWPRNPGRVVAAYAEVLGTPAITLWEDALARWRDDLAASESAEDAVAAGARALEDFAEEVGEQLDRGRIGERKPRVLPEAPKRRAAG